ncbi:FunK1 protein kinase [Histoplasma ohiense]|nr:FunK1 protein kinase [Histoplasma ohiense (nom. inval.)]
MATSKSEIIYPIGNRLEKFRDLHAACSLRHDPNGPTTGDENESEDDIKNQLFELLLTIQTHPACRLLSSEGRLGPLYTSLPRLNVAIASSFEIECLLPLLKAIRDGEPDEIIWDKVYEAVTESTPPPRPVPSFQQTPWRYNTSSIVNSSEHRKYFDPVLKEELGNLYVDVPGFYEAFFPRIESLESTARVVLERCSEGEVPLYREGVGWREWPEGAKERDVLDWLQGIIEEFIHLFGEHAPDRNIQRRPLAQPNKPIRGSTAERKLDIGFVDDSNANKDAKCEWSQILVPGELKNDPKYDKQSHAWLDLGRYVREVITAQDHRCFVHGFTLCGPNMRLWLFHRLGGIASEQFNINNEGLRFASVILGYLLMTEEQLGFDPTIITGDDGLRYIKINRNGEEERLVIDEVITRRACVAGRATTCWKAHRDGDESKTPIVIKDSWQYPERGEEGELLREALEKDVVNVARYYHHETVRAGDGEDDIHTGVRKGLDITKASNYRSNQSRPPLSRSGSRTARKNGTSSRKRSSTSIEPSLPPSKRQSVSPIKRNINEAIPNRVHRRIVVEDYGKPISKSSSRVVLLQALEGCIEGYMSLYEKAGLIQSDISPNNLMINEGGSDGTCRSFLIDLDLAIRRDREESSGARGKTGTRAFMSIGVLLGEGHSFMHDLESFFWVLFWICVHYEGPDKAKVDEDFEKWNFLDMEELAKLKKGEIGDEQDFNSSAKKKFTSYYQPLVPWVNRLRKEVFPDGKRWKKEDRELPERMKEILREACADPKV